MSVINMLPQWPGEETAEATPRTTAQNVTPTQSGYLLSRVTVKAIPNMTVTQVGTKTGQDAQLSVQATGSYKYLICVASSYNNSNITYTGTGTAIVSNVSSNFDGDYQHVTILRDASNVTFKYGANGVGRIIMRVIGLNY